MIGFNYTYKSSQEILDSVTKIHSMSFSDMFGIFISISLFLLFLGIVFPFYILWQQNKKKEAEKKNKKKLLTQILLQKEIEDEVEREIQIEDEQKLVN